MLSTLDAMLRAEADPGTGVRPTPPRAILVLLVAGGMAYGLAMGSFAGRPLQALFSALKVPMLLLVTTGVCLPSFYVLHAVLGLRDDFGAALRAVLTAQATLAVTLASLGPLTLLVYASSSDYSLAIVFNGLQFALATLAAQLMLLRHYRVLIAGNPRHRVVRRAWAVLYVFVAIQLAWVLRPFVGDPGLPARFFREEAWSNAYVVVAQTVYRLFTGL